MGNSSVSKGLLNHGITNSNTNNNNMNHQRRNSNDSFFNSNNHRDLIFGSQFAHSVDNLINHNSKELKKMATQSKKILEYNSQEPSLILAPYLYLGGSHVNKNPHLTSCIGLTHILNMAVELRPHEELQMSPTIKYMHIPADDSLYYNIRHHFEDAFNLIDNAKYTNGKILVHCMMGISRSATIVIAYLMSRYKYPLSTAYAIVKSRRPEINPNPLFMRILQQYEQELIKSEYSNKKVNEFYSMSDSNHKGGNLNNVSSGKHLSGGKVSGHNVTKYHQTHVNNENIRPTSAYFAANHDPYVQYSNRSFYG